MNGNEVYEEKFRRKAENLIKNNPDKVYLRGFYYYINDMSVSSSYGYLNYIVDFMNTNKKQVKDLVLA